MVKILVRGIAQTWRKVARRVGYRHGFGPGFLSFLRPLRVLAYPNAHRRLLALPIYQKFGDTKPFREDPFHHLSHRYYLRRGLDLRQRIDYVYAHYLFESQEWSHEYHRAVYGSEGLELWSHEDGNIEFSIRLYVAPKLYLAEGDLEIGLFVNSRPLHRMSFNWINGTTGMAVLPFVGCSQGLPAPQEGTGHDGDTAFLFDKSFPHSAPSYFCFAALQGVAEAAGSQGLYAVRGVEQVCFNESLMDSHFRNSYDKLWQTLEGQDCGEVGYYIPVPAHTKPLTQLSSSHRRRARKRREVWSEITGSAVETLAPLKRQPEAGATAERRQQ